MVQDIGIKIVFFFYCIKYKKSLLLSPKIKVGPTRITKTKLSGRCLFKIKIEPVFINLGRTVHVKDAAPLQSCVFF